MIPSFIVKHQRARSQWEPQYWWSLLSVTHSLAPPPRIPADPRDSLKLKVGCFWSLQVRVVILQCWPSQNQQWSMFFFAGQKGAGPVLMISNLQKKTHLKVGSTFLSPKKPVNSPLEVSNLLPKQRLWLDPEILNRSFYALNCGEHVCSQCPFEAESEYSDTYFPWNDGNNPS